MVGYDKVVEMANRAGMNYKIQPTPAVALGAYEITPLEAVGAYTIFANQGEYVKPNFISLVRSQDGKVVYQEPARTQAGAGPARGLPDDQPDGRGAAQRHGRRACAPRGFNVPAAGKTGTSHDGWFAGYTSELLCVVWVGFDDNRELDLEGAHSAAPIWAEFMKRALAVPRVSRRQAVPGAGRHCLHRHRSAIRDARHARLPGQAAGSLHRRHAAGGRLPAARRRPARRDQRGRMGNTLARQAGFVRGRFRARQRDRKDEVSEAAVARRVARQNRAECRHRPIAAAAAAAQERREERILPPLVGCV